MTRKSTAGPVGSRTNGPPNFAACRDKISSPSAGSAGRFAILDPVLRRPSPVAVIKTEIANMILEDMINVLRAELEGCILSKRERATAEAELATLVAQRDAFRKTGADAFKDIVFDADERP